MMLTRLRIKLALWLLPKSVRIGPNQGSKSRSQNTVMDGSGPCQIFEDAIASTLFQMETAANQYEAMAHLLIEQTDALFLCQQQSSEP
jgi:hypothetical protein